MGGVAETSDRTQPTRGSINRGGDSEFPGAHVRGSEKRKMRREPRAERGAMVGGATPAARGRHLPREGDTCGVRG